MKQRKYNSGGHTFYEVSFLSHEHPDFSDEKPTTHTAIVVENGYWFMLILIDGMVANSLGYRSPKTAVKNGWIVPDRY